jgi:DNA-directed RNA polymerase specialized sigma24 family protein/CheY-like chemotaxis protein
MAKDRSEANLTANAKARPPGLAEQIRPHLPYLRRFARALSGTQKGGDAYVEALLEAIIANPQTIQTSGTRLRIELYRLLCRLWGSISLNLHASTPAGHWERAAQLKLANLAPRPRQAFLLTAVEGFSFAEAAEILEVSSSEFAEIADQAGREIGEVIAADVLIIEDEPLIAMDIEDIVTRLGHNVIGIARTRREAVEIAGSNRPGIILADVQLADGSSGIDTVNDLLASFEVPVIFITAYPERLLTGDRPEPAFLISKPFAADMVKAMVSQALFFDTRSTSARKVAAS